MVSTTESENSALFYCLHDFIPVCRVLLDLTIGVGVSQSLRDTIRTTVYEDNAAALSLATGHQITARTRYFLVKYHFFWAWYKENEDTVPIVKVDTKLQLVDYLTKGLPCEVLEVIRALVQGW